MLPSTGSITESEDNTGTLGRMRGRYAQASRGEQCASSTGSAGARRDSVSHSGHNIASTVPHREYRCELQPRPRRCLSDHLSVNYRRNEQPGAGQILRFHPVGFARAVPMSVRGYEVSDYRPGYRQIEPINCGITMGCPSWRWGVALHRGAEKLTKSSPGCIILLQLPQAITKSLFGSLEVVHS